MTNSNPAEDARPQSDGGIEPFLVRLDGVAEQLRALIEPVLLGQGLELVQLQLVHGSSRSQLKLFIDRKGASGKHGDGIQMADLEKANRLVGDFLDVEDSQRGLFKSRYDLEVGSPGVDRPLTKQSHFARAVGERAKVRTRAAIEGARAHSGVVTATSAEGVSLKNDAGVVVLLPWREIVSGNTVFVFEDAQRPVPKRQKKSKAEKASDAVSNDVVAQAPSRGKGQRR
jgi:ribosome maturation factor RimP